MLSKKAMGISPSPTLAVDSRAKEMKSQGIDVISFGSGEPDFDTPEHVREAAIKALNEGHTRYTPVAGTVELKEAICNKLKRDNGLDYSPAQIVVSNGAKHSAFITLSAILNPGEEVLIPAPYWVSYPEMVRLNDGVPVTVECSDEKTLKITPADLEKVATTKTKALILNSPSNPTGQVYTEEELHAISDFCCSRDIYIISDEVYEKILFDGARHFSPAAFGEREKEMTIVINGASKTYAMTGWRIGYSATTVEMAKIISSVQSHTTGNANSIAQQAMVAALTGSQECVEEMRLAFDERRQYIVSKTNSIKYLEAINPRGSFYLFVRVAELFGKSYQKEQIMNSDDYARLLLENSKVAVVPGSGFGAPQHIRLSFATSMENIIEGMNRIEAFSNALQ